MRFHTQTAGVSLTWQQPHVNIVRTAIEALAAVLGGTQSLHTNSYDEALALPTEEAVRLALRTQQVIAHETGVVSAIDPLGGAYHVEELTGRLEEEAYAYFAQIEELGGMVEAVKQNFPQREIAEASFRYQSEVEAGQRVVVGVNRYQHDDEEPIPLLKIDPAARAAPDRARAGGARPARRGGRRGCAGRSQGRGSDRRRQPHAPDHRGHQGPHHHGRDVRRAPRRLGHLARDTRLLRPRDRARSDQAPRSRADSIGRRVGCRDSAVPSGRRAVDPVIAPACSSRRRRSRSRSSARRTP